VSRNFDLASGPNYSVNSVGSCGAVGNGAYTIICLFNINSGNNSSGLISFLTSGINAELIVDANQLFGAGDFGGGQTGVTVSTWWWAAVRKAAGTNVYRYSLRQYNTGSTTHQNSASTFADSGVTNTSIRLGDGDDRGNALIAVWAAWTSNLSDSAVAGMFTTAAADVAAQSPQGLWLGNQLSGSDPINDSIGTANQTSVNGSIGVGSDPPSYNYSLSSSGPAFPPNLEQRRRLLVAPRQVRGGGRISSPVRAQVNPPFPLNGIHQPRQLRGKLARRGECWMPIPAQVVVAAVPYPPQPERERIKILRAFRGRMSAPPLDQAPAPPPVHARAKSFRARARMEAVSPVPAQVVVNAPPYPPQSVRTRLRGLRLFRPHLAAPVPSQVVVAPPSYTPLAVRTRLKFARIFRARTAAPVPDQLIAPPAPHPRPRGIAPRRGHAAMPAPPQTVVAPPAYPPRPVRSRLKGLRQSRGREAAMPVPPQIVIPPPPYAPVFARLKKKLVGLFRPSVATPLAAVCDCTTHRPNLGTTSRPGSGITARPNSGTTSRPCSCGND